LATQPEGEGSAMTRPRIYASLGAIVSTVMLLTGVAPASAIDAPNPGTWKTKGEQHQGHVSLELQRVTETIDTGHGVTTNQRLEVTEVNFQNCYRARAGGPFVLESNGSFRTPKDVQSFGVIVHARGQLSSSGTTIEVGLEVSKDSLVLNACVSHFMSRRWELHHVAL
jgi:hypothetical protein